MPYVRADHSLHAYLLEECRNDEEANYDPKPADIWSLGVILLNMLFHRNPFTEPTNNCPSFAAYRANPETWLLGAFDGLTPSVAHYLAYRVFSPVSTGERATAAQFAAWARDLPAHLGLTGPESAAPSRGAGMGITSPLTPSRSRASSTVVSAQGGLYLPPLSLVDLQSAPGVVLDTSTANTACEPVEPVESGRASSSPAAIPVIRAQGLNLRHRPPAAHDSPQEHTIARPATSVPNSGIMPSRTISPRSACGPASMPVSTSAPAFAATTAFLPRPSALQPEPGPPFGQPVCPPRTARTAAATSHEHEHEHKHKSPPVLPLTQQEAAQRDAAGASAASALTARLCREGLVARAPGADTTTTTTTISIASRRAAPAHLALAMSTPQSHEDAAAPTPAALASAAATPITAEEVIDSSENEAVSITGLGKPTRRRKRGSRKSSMNATRAKEASAASASPLHPPLVPGSLASTPSTSAATAGAAPDKGYGGGHSLPPKPLTPSEQPLSWRDRARPSFSSTRSDDQMSIYTAASAPAEILRRSHSRTLHPISEKAGHAHAHAHSPRMGHELDASFLVDMFGGVASNNNKGKGSSRTADTPSARHRRPGLPSTASLPSPLAAPRAHHSLEVSRERTRPHTHTRDGPRALRRWPITSPTTEGREDATSAAHAAPAPAQARPTREAERQSPVEHRSRFRGLFRK